MIRKKAINSLYACPCCGYATLSEPSNFEICEICFWEDDGQYNEDQEINYEGPNHVSLKEARFNFIVYGSSNKKDIQHVRSAKYDDIKLINYKLVYDIIIE